VTQAVSSFRENFNFSIRFAVLFCVKYIFFWMNSYVSMRVTYVLSVYMFLKEMVEGCAGFDLHLGALVEAW
jgi:hypothetical protein